MLREYGDAEVSTVAQRTRARAGKSPSQANDARETDPRIKAQVNKLLADFGVAKLNAKILKEKWGVDVRHQVYNFEGRWYHGLKQFPGALFDPFGYVRFETKEDYENNPGIHISPSTDLEVRGGLSSLQGYVKVENKPIELPESAVAPDHIIGNDEERRRGAPPPSTTRKGIMHMRNAEAHTYAMIINRASEIAFKIGWAFNATARQREFNLAAVPALGGLHYEIKLSHLWDTARNAYSMEQSILRHLDKHRHPANREVITGITFDRLEEVWKEQVAVVRRKGLVAKG